MTVIINNHKFSDLGKRGLFTYCNDNEMVGIYNKELEIVIPFEYQSISDDSFVAKDGNIYFQALKDDVWGAIDLETKEFIPADKDVDDAIYQEGEKFGVVNPLGEFIVPPIYDEIQQFGHSWISTKYTTGDDAVVELAPCYYLLINHNGKDKLYGLADDNGVLVEPTYDWIEEPNNFPYMEYLNYPAYSVAKDGRMGYINSNGEVLVDCIYEETFSDVKNSKACAVTENDEFQVIDLKTKKVLFTDNIDNIQEFYVSDYNECFSIESLADNKTKVFDENGNQVAEFELDKQYRYHYLANNLILKQYAEPLATDNVSDDVDSEDLATVSEQLIDYDGNIVSDKYRMIFIIENTDYYLCEMDSVYNKFEVIDKNGNVVKENLYNVSLAGEIPCKSLRYAKCPVWYWNFGEDPFVTSDGYFWSPEGFEGDESVYIGEFKGLFVNGTIYRYETEINIDESTETLSIYSPNGEIYKKIVQKYEPCNDIEGLDDEMLDF